MSNNTKIERLAETFKKYLEERKRKDSKVVSIFIYSKQKKTKAQLYRFDFKRDLKLYLSHFKAKRDRDRKSFKPHLKSKYNIGAIEPYIMHYILILDLIILVIKTWETSINFLSSNIFILYFYSIYF